MCHRSQGRNAIFLSGIGRGRSQHTADVGCTGTIVGRIKVMGAAGTEFHDRPSVRCLDDATGLGGDERLVVHRQQQRGLQKLCIDDLRLDTDERFIRKDRCAFRDRIDVAGKDKMAKIVQKLLREFIERTKIGDILLLKMQILDVADHFLQTGADAVTAAVGVAAVKHVEDDFFVLVSIEITLAHRQFIKVHDQRKVPLVTKIKFSVKCLHLLILNGADHVDSISFHHL